jgi:mannose-6-phosphate isomerase-like protein (cupin superfamily)
MVHKGQLGIQWAGQSLMMGPGDTLTVPKNLSRVFVNEGQEVAVAYVVRGGDHPGAARLE